MTMIKKLVAYVCLFSIPSLSMAVLGEAVINNNSPFPAGVYIQTYDVKNDRLLETVDLIVQSNTQESLIIFSKDKRRRAVRISVLIYKLYDTKNIRITEINNHEEFFERKKNLIAEGSSIEYSFRSWK